jgi:hypothetical protein
MAKYRAAFNPVIQREMEAAGDRSILDDLGEKAGVA